MSYCQYQYYIFNYNIIKLDTRIEIYQPHTKVFLLIMAGKILE
jgi:hypothetical protein